MFCGNRFRDLRFAVHYMYTNDGEVTDNVSIGNTVGYAIMYSHRLTIRGNVSDGDRDHGFLFNFANGSQIAGNVVAGASPAGRALGEVGHAAATRRASTGLPGDSEPKHTLAAGDRIGPEKCVFIYNANKNRFRDNWFEGCEIGIHFTAGSEGNEIVGNAFIRNRNQVKYVGTRYLDWSKDGRGNYWSDNPAFDLERRRPGRQRLPAERPRRPGAVDRAAGQGADEQPRRAGDPLGAGAVPGPAAGRRRRQPSPDGAARRARSLPKEAGHDRNGRDPQRRQALRQGRGGARRLLRPCRKARRWRSSATTAPARPR